MTAPARTSVYEREARQRKTLRIVMSIDAGLQMLGVDPFSARAVEYVEATTDAAWQLAASHARVPMPSATTIRAVEDIYRRRVEVHACLSRITASSRSALKGTG